MSDLKPGAYIEVAYPFIEQANDAGNSFKDDAKTCKWRPGTRNEQSAPDDYDTVADGIGTMILTIVSTHTPPGWPTRVFYTRLWRDPDGKEYGKKELRCHSAAWFTQLCKGYRHAFRHDGEWRSASRERITFTGYIEARAQ